MIDDDNGIVDETTNDPVTDVTEEVIHSELFSETKDNYNNGELTDFSVRLSVIRKDITPDEYTEITGERYEVI